MEDVTWTEVDGVPTVWAKAPGPLKAALSFRTGHCDETPTTRGISHLTEHLTLHGLHGSRYSYNGFVEMSRTVFHAAGTEEQVTAFLAHVGRALDGGLPADRVAVERGVLRAEAAERSRSFEQSLVQTRFGVRAHGLAGYAETGLQWLDEESLRWWIQQRYGRGNAVLWLSGPPPAGLSLTLPEGPRRPAPAPDPIEKHLPAWYSTDVPGIAVSGLVRRSHATSIALGHLSDELNRLLRFEAGVTYGVQGGLTRLDASTAHVMFGAKAAAEHTSRVRDVLVATVERLAREGVRPDTVEAAVAERLPTEDGDPEAVLGLLDTAAFDELSGRPRFTTERYFQELRAVDAAAARDVLREVAASALYVLPHGLDLPSERYREIDRWSRTTVTGETWRPVPGTDHDAYGARLVVGREGASIVYPESRAVTVRWDDLALIAWWQDGARTLVSTDNFSLPVNPDEWFEGPAAVARIDTLAPRDKYVPYGAGDPGTARRIAEAATMSPAKETPEVPLPGGFTWRPAYWWAVVAIGALMALRLLTTAVQRIDRVDGTKETIMDWPSLVLGVVVAGACVWGGVVLARRHD